jgi:hypothetical protein
MPVLAPGEFLTLEDMFMYPVALRTSVLALGLAAMAAIPFEQASARDFPVCYKTKEYEPTRLVLNVAFHSRLPTTKFTGKQEVWDAAGKHSYTENHKNVMAVFDGAVVTSAPTKRGYGQPKGAHLGGTSYFVRGGTGIGPQNGTQNPMDWECTSAEPSPIPSTWACTLKSDDYKSGIPVTLYRLKNADKECDVFQDTYDNPKPPKRH